MFEETYQISRELTEQLLHEMYHPNADEIKRNNEALEKVRQTMHITTDGNGATVEFDYLDLSFLNQPTYISGNWKYGAKEFVPLDWTSDDKHARFVLAKSSLSAA